MGACDNYAVNAILTDLRCMPLLQRCATVGTVSGGLVGAIAGLIIGLSTHAATAWFALFELGIPAGVVGGLAGLIAALMVMGGRRIRRSITRSA